MWGLKCNSKKTKMIVFKKGVKLKNHECWHKRGHNLEVVSEITNFGVKPRKHRELEKAESED